MSKVNSAYQSLVRGVSQQQPEARLPGQMEEQINMLSDPVRGLIRRQGTLQLTSETVQHVSVDDLAERYWSDDLKVEDRELTLLLRRPGLPAASGNGHQHRHGGSGTAGPALWAVNKGGADDAKLLPVDISAAAQAALAGGVNAVTAVGRFLLLAGTGTVADTNTTEVWNTVQNRRRAVVQFKVAPFSRTLTIRYRAVGAGSEIVASITTPSAAFQGDLDTSGIAASDPEYQKKVNDLVNAYQSDSTQWIASATALVQPVALVAQMQLALQASGLSTAHFWTSGPSIVFDSLVQEIEYIRVDDGGDGTVMKATHMEVEDAADLPTTGIIGQVIKVAPRGEDGYYVKAEGPALGPTMPTAGSRIGSITWRECPATNSQPASPFCIGAIVGGTLYIGASPTDLTTFEPAVGTVPAIGGRTAGDADTSPRPNFIGRAVTMLAYFQDRLLVGSGNVVDASRIGDYFNFYRVSALTVPDNDPVQMYASGSESDVLRKVAFFDKNLVVFGDQAQYTISGRVPLTPATSVMSQSSAHADAADVRPLPQGDLLFYVRANEDGTRLHQIEIGNVEDTTSSFDVSEQLDDYIKGEPWHMAAASRPNYIILRTSGYEGLVLFRYIDGGQGRVLDSWSRWEFDPGCGRIVAVSTYRERLRIMWAREVSGTVRFVVDEVPLTPGLLSRPYLDSSTPSTSGRPAGELPLLHCANGSSPVPTQAWQGRQDSDTAALAATVGLADTFAVGFPFESSVTLTSPRIKDRDGLSITAGRLTVNALSIGYKDGIGMVVDVTTPYGDFRSVDYNGLRVGLSTLDHLEPTTGKLRAVIGRETRDYLATIRSRNWLPLALTHIEWYGQFLNNTRRV